MHDEMVKLSDENSILMQLLTEREKELFLLKYSDISRMIMYYLLDDAEEKTSNKRQKYTLFKEKNVDRFKSNFL